MQHIQEIEKAVSQLSQTDLASFREWYDKFDQKIWDEQFESDVGLGKLNSLAEQALSDLKAGKCKEI